MTDDDMTQKLALLPEGLAEENVLSWQDARHYYQQFIFDHADSIFKYLLDLIESVLQIEEAKLFRVYPDKDLLILSTTTEEDRVYGDFFIVVRLIDESTTDIGCYRPTEAVDSVVCKSNEILLKLQTLLNRLWNETRGKKNT